jgi:hypothetical protein
MLGDRRAYVYKTSDYGQTWQSIASGLPESPVFVVREDPNQRGFSRWATIAGCFTPAMRARIGTNGPPISPPFRFSICGSTARLTI